MTRSAVVVGYATVDYPANVPDALRGPGTRAAVALTPANWPRAGGAALYASTRVAAAGHRVHPLVTLGEDGNGSIFLNACRDANVSVDGIHCTPLARTPWCFLLYHHDGTYTCLIDTGGVNEQPLTHAQLDLCKSADLICIAAAPAANSARVLSVAPNAAPLVWIAKDDPMCFPEWLCAELAARADIIFCNSSERALVQRARALGHMPQQVIVETRGSRGVLVEGVGGRRTELHCEAFDVGDTTGAGDTLAGEVLAALLSGCSSVERAVQQGMAAARSLLLGRR